MRSYRYDRPKEILALNLLGLMVWVVAMYAVIGAVRAHQWPQFAGWLTLAFAGMFMLMVYVPFNYPSKLFEFDGTDAIWIAWFTAMFLAINTDPRLKMSTKGAVLNIFGLWLVFLGSKVLMKLGGRVGVRIERWTRRPSAQIARITAVAKKVRRSEEIYPGNPLARGTFFFEPWVPAVEVETGRRVEIQVLDVSGMFPGHVLVNGAAGYRSVREFFILKEGQG